MAERAAAHEDRNLARKLTPAERREKKLKKLLGAEVVEGEAVDMQVALYKVGGQANVGVKCVRTWVVEAGAAGMQVVLPKGKWALLLPGSSIALPCREGLVLGSAALHAAPRTSLGGEAGGHGESYSAFSSLAGPAADRCP